MNDNLMGVGSQGDKIIIVFRHNILSKKEAINMAAWIVAMTDEDEFKKEYNEVINS